MKVVKAWYMAVEFLKDDANRTAALEILSARVGLTPEQYEPLLAGTYILSLEEALGRWEDAEGFGSVYGSSEVVDEFNLTYEVYGESQDFAAYLDPSLTIEYAASKAE